MENNGNSLINLQVFKVILLIQMMMDFSFGLIPLIFILLVIAFKDGNLNWIISFRPKLNFKVWRLDSYGKLDNISYGVVNLPNETGAFDLEVPTWRPMSGWREESYSYYLGGPPKLVNSDPIVKDLNQRKFLTSMSSGTVHIHCEVLMKAFRDNYISGDKWELCINILMP